MFASLRSQPQWLKTPLSASMLLRLSLDPLLIVGTLYAVAVAQRAPLGSPYVILALIVFSLTFPGTTHVGVTRRALLRDVISGWLALSAILLFFGYATRSLNVFPRDVLLAWFAAAPLALFLAHDAVRVLLPRVVNLDRNQRRAVIVGASEIGRDLAQRLSGNPLLGIQPIGFFDDRSRERLGDLPGPHLYGGLDQLPAFVKSQRVDLIYVSLPMASQPRILQLLDALRDTTASIYFVPDIFVVDLIQARLDDVGGLPVVAVCETPFYGLNGLIKRSSDLVLATLILMLIAPVMLVIAAGVKLTSPGPVLFTQRRYGLDGRDIVVYKFRSMTVAEDGADVRQATKNDRRVTRLGAVLRKTSLDELPQFINVLQGRMSIVGPRPHAVAHNEQYRKLISGYMVRHKVKPGITGWAQVHGLRGETDTLDKMRARIEYDLQYLRNWSLKLDLQIIVRTVWVVLKGTAAY